MQFFKNLSIKYKLFFAYAAVSLVVFSISFTLLFYQFGNHLERRIMEELSKSNQTITDMVETAATVSIKNHLRGIAEKNKEILAHIYQDFKDNLLTEAQAKKQAVDILLSQTVGETGYIYCIDSKGIAVVHPRPKIRNKDFSYRKFIQSQIRDKEGYLEYNWKNPGELDERPKALYMSYFEPWDWIISVSSYKSEFAKLVSVDDFEDRILGLKFGETGYSFIFDTLGNVVVHPEITGNFLDFRDVKGTPFLREMIERKKGYLTYYWKNPSEPEAREKFVAFSHINDFNWIIASSSYTAEVFSPMLEIQRFFYVILIIAVLVIAVVSLLVSTSITRPLRKFIMRFEKGAEGDLTSKIEETGKDEIGKLSLSFNLFMDRLNSYQTEITTEIKHREKTEKELSSLRNHLVNIIDSMPSMIIGVDSKLNVTLWNKQAAQLTGIPADNAYGKYITRLLPRTQIHVSKIEESFKTGEIKQILKSPYGETEKDVRYENIIVYPLSGARDQGAVIRIDDVTDTLRMEETLIQNEKMLSVGGLAAGMAHEINNPLAGVIQNANLLTNRLTDTEMPANIDAAKKAGTTMAAIEQFMVEREIPRIISGVTESSTRMADIVGNMLSFARKSDESFSTHSPAELLDKILDIAATDYDLKKQYDFKSILIEKEYEPDLPMIRCEGSKIQQVLLNILTNGAQAMAGNRSDDPSKFILRLSREKKAGMLRMEIEDNGPGIEPAIRKRIFEPFFTTKPVGVGTGLGLSVSYFIITENHNGTMHVVSPPGKGSRFIIRLPLADS
ncbi:MAG: cache domain-containing protein [Desulfobacterales bacterium]|nr:cache domain-containing protein [Desulfobacterales bacterium]